MKKVEKITKLKGESEKEIALTLLNLPIILKKSLEVKSVNDIADFIYTLTSKYNKFYAENKVLLEKDKLLKEKEYFKHAKLITVIVNISQLTLYLLTNFLINNLVFTIISSFLSLEMTFFNYLFYIYYKRELNGINNLLNSLETNQLPNEKEFLEKRKIINIKEYLNLKNQINIYNQYDYDYPGRINYQNDFKISDNTYGKILEFKLKDEK